MAPFTSSVVLICDWIKYPSTPHSVIANLDLIVANQTRSLFPRIAGISYKIVNTRSLWRKIW